MNVHRCVAILIVLLVGCSEKSAPPPPAKPTCGVEGASVECACPGGTKGAQVCLPNGTFMPCKCDAPAATATEKPTGVEPTAPTPAGAPDPALTRPAPKLTAKVFLDKGAAPYVDRPHGVLMAVGAADPVLACGAELDALLARLKRIVADARQVQADPEFVDGTTCEAKGPHLVCDYSHPMPDEGDDNSMARFVFATGAGGKPVLAAALLGQGATLDTPKVKAALAVERTCP